MLFYFYFNVFFLTFFTSAAKANAVDFCPPGVSAVVVEARQT